MNTFTLAIAQWFALAALLVVPSFGGDQDEALKKDLTAVIALHGLPCGEVVAVKIQGDNDYAASCKDGNNYHVYLTKDGRVVVEKQK